MLVAGMLMTGCSKDSESMGTKDNTELTKEQIVGVWRSGDYWVSFGNDGFYSAFFFIDDVERIDDGNFTIDGDVLTIKNPEHSTSIVVKKLSKTSITIVMEYTYPGLARKTTVTKEMNFTKTNEIPCKSNDYLVGKSFSYEDTSDVHDGRVITFFNEIPYNDRIMVSKYSEPGRYGNSVLQYYVYLPPLIYHAILRSGGIYLKEDKVLIGELSESSEGILTYKRIR